MKSFFSALFLSVSVLLSAPLLAQKAIINIAVANTGAKECTLLIHNNRLTSDYLKKGFITLVLSDKKTLSYTLNITEPQFVTLYCDSIAAKDSPSLDYTFFVSPGDKLNFKANFLTKGYGFIVSGKGAHNNQPLANQLGGIAVQKFYGDTTPYRILPAIIKEQKTEADILAKYIALYKPSEAFIAAYQNQVQYYAAQAFYAYKGGNKFRIGEAYNRGFKTWQHVTDSLFATIKLDDPQALVSYKYMHLLNDFLLREKEELWTKSYRDSSAFYKEWYNDDRGRGKTLFNDDPQNLLQEKIVNKYFSGKVAEYLYAVIFDEAFAESNFKNVVTIFERFKKRFPRSKYVGWFAPLVNDIIRRQTYPLAADMVIAKDNGTNLKTFDEVLALTKGKVVLLDMWGTWCGPCRNETEKNGEAIKAYFKGKGLEYVYVANRDLENEQTWKGLIAYFKMTGLHILASGDLSKDIMKKVKGSGYPTYVVINKDGTFEQSRAGYPMDRKTLIKQIEEALAK